MKVIERGSGTPVVIIPGIQGRWEWMSPAVDALAEHFRVITFSLCDEPSSGFTLDPERGIENYLDQIAQVFEEAQLQDAVLIGVSFSGPIAAEFTARHPERVRALVLVSALPPDWQPDARARFYLRAPLLLSPIFLIDAPTRAYREVRAALPGVAERLRFSVGQVARLTRYFVSPSRMAARIGWLARYSFCDPSCISRPVMIITGERALDRVVPTHLTERYVTAIPHARRMVIGHTGHLGLLTKSREFGAAVSTFIDEISTDVRRASA